jgi:6-phosphogluconate dehydrogenase
MSFIVVRWYTERRARELAPHGLHYLGMGVSGGEEGALNGPSLMPGWRTRAPTTRCADPEEDCRPGRRRPVRHHVGTGSAGHFVKMVHNGIEYGDMQLIAECLRPHAARARHVARARWPTRFAQWNAGELESFLIEITARILRAQDPETESPMVEVILDSRPEGHRQVDKRNRAALRHPGADHARRRRSALPVGAQDARVAASKVLHGRRKVSAC